MSEAYVRECGARITRTCEALELRPVDLAKLLKIKPSALGNYMAGNREIPRQVLARWKRIHGVNFDWIYDGDMSSLPRHLADKIEGRAA